MDYPIEVVVVGIDAVVSLVFYAQLGTIRKFDEAGVVDVVSNFFNIWINHFMIISHTGSLGDAQDKKSRKGMVSFIRCACAGKGSPKPRSGLNVGVVLIHSASERDSRARWLAAALSFESVRTVSTLSACICYSEILITSSVVGVPLPDVLPAGDNESNLARRCCAILLVI